MRKFDRIDPPPVWGENEARWNQQWVELLARNGRAQFVWYIFGGRSARDIALPTLKAQTSEHCSFCDGFPVENVSTDTVEHFRPKCHGRFPDRAYSWTNLYYCCCRCQSHKLEKWDDDLLAADDPEYAFHRFFEFDFTTGELRPSSVASDAEKRRATVTISTYGLDTQSRRRFRLIELRKWTRVPPEERHLQEFAYRDFLEPGGR